MNNIIKAWALGLIILISNALNGQQSTNTAGGFYQNNQNSLSWGLGELAIETLIANDYIVTQGFQQSLLGVTAIDETPGMDANIKVFPNPISEFVTIDIDAPDYEGYEYLILGPKGEIIEQNKFMSKLVEISLEKRAQGIYFLKVTNEKQQVKTFKIVKN